MVVASVPASNSDTIGDSGEDGSVGRDVNDGNGKDVGTEAG